MEKTCESCIYEYTCDWTAAGQDSCENWRADKEAANEEGRH